MSVPCRCGVRERRVRTDRFILVHLQRLGVVSRERVGVGRGIRDVGPFEGGQWTKREWVL